MTRNDLTIRFAERMGIDPEEATPYVETFMSIILDNLGKGDRIEIRNFGVFQIIERNARVARNPKTGIKVQVAAKRTVKFKAGKSLLERVREVGCKEAELQITHTTAANNND
ncbi:MAG: integration host factor subunit beta [Candidatus Hydrogenedentes bacterium]|nr:integration host factor subunit beta [Candidatus Hydrogenedentota bacterium]